MRFTEFKLKLFVFVAGRLRQWASVVELKTVEPAALVTAADQSDVAPEFYSESDGTSGPPDHWARLTASRPPGHWLELIRQKAPDLLSTIATDDSSTLAADVAALESFEADGANRANREAFGEPGRIPRVSKGSFPQAKRVRIRAESKEENTKTKWLNRLQFHSPNRAAAVKPPYVSEREVTGPSNSAASVEETQPELYVPRRSLNPGSSLHTTAQLNKSARLARPEYIPRLSQPQAGREARQSNLIDDRPEKSRLQETPAGSQDRPSEKVAHETARTKTSLAAGAPFRERTMHFVSDNAQNSSTRLPKMIAPESSFDSNRSAAHRSATNLNSMPRKERVQRGQSDTRFARSDSAQRSSKQVVSFPLASKVRSEEDAMNWPANDEARNRLASMDALMPAFNNSTRGQSVWPMLPPAPSFDLADELALLESEVEAKRRLEHEQRGTQWNA